MKKRLLIAVMLFFFAIGYANAQNFDIRILNADSSYKQGDSASVFVFVKLLNPELEFDKAVVFLNVVEIDKARKYPQAAHKIFASASIDHNIFKTVYSKKQLESGVAANINYSFKNGAKPAKYAIVIQVFEGTNTDPHRLRGKHRLAMKAHNFELTAK